MEMKTTPQTFIYLLILFFLNSACSNELENTQDSPTEDLAAISSSENTDTVVERNLPNLFSDTLTIGNYYLIIHQTDTSVTLVDYPKSNLKYTKKELPDTSRVIKNPDSLTFLLKNGTKFSLKDVGYLEDESNFLETVSYHYVNSIGNYWQVDALCYEYNYTVLINQYSGDTINTIAPGPISPSKRLMLCSNVDLESQYTENGIEIFELSDNRHTKIGFTEILNWGLFEIEWISDTRLKAVKVDMTEKYDYELRNVVIELVKK